MTALENAATGAYLVATLALALIALRAARHAGTRKVWILALGFALLLAKAVLLAVSLFTRPDWESLLAPSLVLDVAALACFYGAMFR